MEEDKYTRGKPRTVKWHDSKGAKKDGTDLSDVLRDVVQHEMDVLGWEQDDLAEHLGVGQATVSRFLSGHTPMKSSDLSKLCILLEMSPVRLFGTHPAYYDDARAKMVFPKDHLYTRFNALLRNSEAHELVDAIQEAQELGAGREALRAVQLAVETAKAARQKATREARRSGRRRQIRKHSQAVTEP